MRMCAIEFELLSQVLYTRPPSCGAKEAREKPLFIKNIFCTSFRFLMYHIKKIISEFMTPKK